ncbi:Clavaminate synthase-like protein [Stipitochalara longipes BDJ]|nr:Clavaminate synthase-like protein [Stipitochalara longipes BDJ]
MSSDDFVPTIDISRYTDPKSPEDKELLIAEVRDACLRHGFLQIKKHNVPLSTQHRMLESIGNLFNLPREKKLPLSLKKRIPRRGYEGPGDQLQREDLLPDSKEGFYIGPEEPDVNVTMIHGPNVWPELSEEKFRGPVLEYYQEMIRLGRILWEILVQSLGHPVTVLDGFTRHPAVFMKLIRYPPHNSTDPRQFGAGPHTDFGGVTLLLQQPGKHGLEVWHAAKQQWIPVPAIEDIYVVNLGDMIQKWTGGEYKSTQHRVINKGDGERISCATFWHGDLDATSPLDPHNPSRETVEQYIVRRFSKNFSLPPAAEAAKVG